MTFLVLSPGERLALCACGYSHARHRLGAGLAGPTGGTGMTHYRQPNKIRAKTHPRTWRGGRRRGAKTNAEETTPREEPPAPPTRSRASQWGPRSWRVQPTAGCKWVHGVPRSCLPSRFGSPRDCRPAALDIARGNNLSPPSPSTFTPNGTHFGKPSSACGRPQNLGAPRPRCTAQHRAAPRHAGVAWPAGIEDRSVSGATSSIRGGREGLVDRQDAQD